MKAILVLDVNEKDIGKKVNYINVQGGGMSYIVGSMGKDVRLRPLPQKVDMDMNEYYEGLADGWNACIDEIMGEPE